VIRTLPLHPPFELNFTGNATAVLLWAGPLKAMPAALRAAEPVFDVPSPQIAGVRAKDSPAMQQGYFLEGYSSVASLVAGCKASGLSYVMLMGWALTEGHNVVDTKKFPGVGDDGLKDAVAELHKAGLKVGIHFLSCLIGKNGECDNQLSICIAGAAHCCLFMNMLG
jgi:hypothetical protein